MKALLSWFVSGWQQLALGLALVTALSGWAYVQGRIDGGNAILAGETKDKAEALAGFKSQTKTVVVGATKGAFADFDAKLQIMGQVTDNLAQQYEITHANAQTLADAMRGRFSLTAAERLRLECVRRPSDGRCGAAAGAN